MKKTLVTVSIILSLLLLVINQVNVRGTGISIRVNSPVNAGQPVEIDFYVMAGEPGVATVRIQTTTRLEIWRSDPVNVDAAGGTYHVIAPGSIFLDQGSTPPGTYVVSVEISGATALIDEATATFQVVPPAGGYGGRSPRVHVGAIGSPFNVGQAVHIQYSTDVGLNGVALVAITTQRCTDPSDPSCSAIWASSALRVIGGTTYDLDAPGLSTPGWYNTIMAVQPEGGLAQEYDYNPFEVVGGGGAAGGCLAGTLSSSTISVGTSSVTFSGRDTCDIPGSQVNVRFYQGACYHTGGVINEFTLTTDSSSAFSTNLATSSLSAGSYCVVAHTVATNVGEVVLPLTVTSGTTPPPSGGGFDFTLAFSPSTLSVTAGGTANYQILITYSAPSYSDTTISVQGVTGLGPGMNYQIIPSPAGLRVSTSSSTPAGTYTITLIGSAMGVTRQASATLIVQGAQQAFDFSIVSSPLDRIVNPGGSVTYTVTVSLVSGTTQSVTLSVPDAPSGVSVAFSQTSGSPPFTSTLTVSASQSASPGKYGLTVTGVGGGKTHTVPVGLVIEASPDFRVEVNPPSQSVLQGETASYSVHVVGLNGFNSQVSLTVDGLPAGVNGVFSVPSSSPDFTTTLTLTIPSDSPTGSFALTITGSGVGLNRVANVVLTVNPTTQTRSSQSTQAGGGSTSSGLLDYIQQNSLLVVGLLGVIIILLGALALRARRPPYTPQPSYPPQPQPSSITCASCGTQNPAGNEFCANCGNRLP